MKTINQIKEICGGLATVKKVRGEASAIISFHKNWGHGKLGGDKSQGTLGQLAAAEFAVESGHYGNEYTVTKQNTKPATATPGPWTVGVYVENDFEPGYFPVERDERDENGFVKDVVPLIAKVTYGDGDEAKLANARLLCAAPELLAACKHLLAFFKSEHPEAFKAGGGSFATDDRAPFELDLAAAKAAIKKATK